MRIKAKASLARLKALKNKRRKFVSISELDKDTWTECKTNTVFSGANLEAADRYIKLIDWANKKAKGRYTRADGSFWFENKKDAFKFKLKYGDPGGKE